MGTHPVIAQEIVLKSDYRQDENMHFFNTTTNIKLLSQETAYCRIPYFAFSRASVNAGMISKMSPTMP